MDDLNAFQRDCLYVVAGLDRPQGTDIREELDRYYDGEVYHARLYPALDDLVEAGYVRKEEKDKRSNAYSLTARAWGELEARREWESTYLGKTVERPPLP